MHANGRTCTQFLDKCRSCKWGFLKFAGLRMQADHAPARSNCGWLQVKQSGAGADFPYGNFTVNHTSITWITNVCGQVGLVDSYLAAGARKRCSALLPRWP